MKQSSAENKTPKLAVLWGHRIGAVVHPVGLFVAVPDVPLIAGFRTIESGHIDVWPQVQSRWPDLKDLEYDEQPRGRVNWREADRKFLVLLDKRLQTSDFLSRLFKKLEIERSEALVLSDPHYR